MKNVLRKSAVILLAVLLLTIIPALGATAEDDGPELVVTFDAADLSGNYPITVKFTNAWGIDAANVTLEFDPAQITPVSTDEYEDVDEYYGCVSNIKDNCIKFAFMCVDDDGYTDDEEIILGSPLFTLADEALSADYIEVTATVTAFMCNDVVYSAEQRAAMSDVQRLSIHHYSEPDYQFSIDYATCTAMMVCQDEVCNHHIQAETVDTSYVVRGNPDCNSGGRIWYIADFTKDGFEHQEIPVNVDKIGHTGGEPEVDSDSVVPATCTEDGRHDVVVSCIRCGFELSRETVTDPAFGHTPAEEVRENEVASQCLVAGSYDTVIYCETCGIELQRETVTTEPLQHRYIIPVDRIDPTCTEQGYTIYKCYRCGDTINEDFVDATGHTPLDAVEANRTEPTCVSEGGYDMVVYCEVCGTEISREHTVIPASSHTPAAAVTENQVAATCTANGSYDSVVYCSVCGTEISRDHNVTPTISHTPSDTVIENQVAATCTANGSYDSVVYCSVCGTELSRSQNTVNASGHAYGVWASVDDNNHQRICANDASHVEIAAHEWNDGVITTPPSVTSTGTMTYTCNICQGQKIVSIPRIILITYYPGGGLNAPAAQTKTYGVDLTLTNDQPTKSFTLTFDTTNAITNPATQMRSCTFTGWNTQLNGTGTAYAPGTVYRDNSNLYLYAQWSNPKAGTLPTVTAQTLDFLGWYTEKTGGMQVTADTVITKNMTLYGHWKQKTSYKVTYYPGGGTNAPAPQYKIHGVDLTLTTAKPTKSFTLTFDTTNAIANPTAVTRSCTFTKWNTKLDGTGVTPGAIYKSNAALTLYAQWSNPKAGTLPTVTAQTLDFLGWYTEKTGGTKVTADTVITKSMTLYGHWKTKEYKVTYYPGGGTGAPAAQYKKHGVDLTLTTAKPTKSFTLTFDTTNSIANPAAVTRSCTFTKWNTKVDGTGVTPGAVYKSNAAMTLYAQWSNPKAGTLPTVTAQTLDFLGWYTEKTGGTQVTADTVITKNMTLYGHWKTKEYKVTYYPGGGTGTPTAQTKTYGKDLTLTTDKPSKAYVVNFSNTIPIANPAGKTLSCTFTGWNTQLNGTGTGFASGDVYTNNTNLTLYAQWTNPTIGTLPAPTAQTYDFIGWFTAASGGEQVTANTVITKNMTLYGRWKLKTYKVTYYPGGGTGAPAAQTKTYGKDLTLTSDKPTKAFTINFNSNGGNNSVASKTVLCTFTGWNTQLNGAGMGFASGDVYTNNANLTVYAQWINPTAGSLPTPTRSGYTFLGWYTAKTGGMKITATTVITGNTTLYAQWKAN